MPRSSRLSLKYVLGAGFRVSFISTTFPVYPIYFLEAKGRAQAIWWKTDIIVDKAWDRRRNRETHTTTTPARLIDVFRRLVFNDIPKHVKAQNKEKKVHTQSYTGKHYFTVETKDREGALTPFPASKIRRVSSTNLSYVSFALSSMRYSSQITRHPEHSLICRDNSECDTLLLIIPLCTRVLSLKHLPVRPIYTWPQATGNSYTPPSWHFIPYLNIKSNPIIIPNYSTGHSIESK